MPKLRKVKRKQKFRHDRNRKRVNKSQNLTSNKNIKVDCDVMKKNWDHKQAVKTNLTNMGLSYDPNRDIKVKSVKSGMLEKIKHIDVDKEIKSRDEPKKLSKVVQSLQEECESTKPQQTFRFTKEQVRWISFLIDNHGDDYKAMAKDKKNIWQETPNQIRQKIKKFVSIPEHFASFCKERNMLESENTPEDANI